MSTRFGHSSSFPIVFPEDQQMRLLGINKSHLGYIQRVYVMRRLWRFGDVKIRNCYPLPNFLCMYVGCRIWINEISDEMRPYFGIYMLKWSDPLPVQQVLTWSNLFQSHCAGEFLVSSFHKGHNHPSQKANLALVRPAIITRHTSTCSHHIHSLRIKVHNTAGELSERTSSQLPLTQHLEKPPQKPEAMGDRPYWPLKQG